MNTSKKTTSRFIDKQSGLVILALSFIISSILGGALRYLSSEGVISTIVQGYLDKNNESQISYKIGPSKILFKKGWFPDLSLYIESIDLKTKDCNDERSYIRFEKVFLPISIVYTLEDKKLSFSKLNVEKSVIDLTLNCMSSHHNSSSRLDTIQSNNLEEEVITKKTEEDSESLVTSNKQIIIDVKEYVSDFFKLAKSVHKHIKKIHFDNLTLKKSIQQNILITELTNLNLRMDAMTEIFVDGKFRVASNEKTLSTEKKVLLFDALMHSSFIGQAFNRFELKFSPQKISGNLVTRFREGVITSEWNGDFHSSILKLDVKVKNFPSKSLQGLLSHLFKEMNFDLNQNLSWFNGEFNLKYDLKSQIDPVHFGWKNLKINSGHGYIQAENQPLKSTKEKFFPIKLAVHKINLKDWLMMLGYDGLPGVATHYGFLKGDLLLFKDNSVNFHGGLYASKIEILGNGYRVHQIINEALFSIDTKVDKINFKVKEIKLKDGKFEGSISVNTDDGFKTSEVLIDVNDFKLKKEIEEKIFLGSLDQAVVKGRFELISEKIVAWKGKLEVGQYSNNNHQVENFKFFTTYKNGYLLGPAKADKVIIKESSPYHDLVKAMFLDFIEDKSVVFKNIEAHLKIGTSKKRFWQWEPIAFSTLKGAFKVKSNGIVEEKKMKSNVQILVDEKETIEWLVSGNINNPEFRATDETIKKIKLMTGKDDTDIKTNEDNFTIIKEIIRKKYKSILDKIKL